MPSDNIVESDVLVIGGGMSGIFASIKAREEGVKVTLVDKGYIGKTGSVFFAEGFYSVFSQNWGHNLKAWMDQIAKTGDYMNDPTWTEITLKESYDRHNDLLSWGVKFLTEEDGKPIYARREALEARCIGMGWKWLPAMRDVLLKSGVKIIDRIVVTDLIQQDGKVVGAVGFHLRQGDFYVFKAKATVICTGGGTGEAMAYRAGADISGKEFLVGAGAYRYAGSGLYGEKGESTTVSFKKEDIKPAPAWNGGAAHYIDRYLDVEGNKVNRYTIGSAIHSGRGPILWNLDGATPKEISDNTRELKQGGTLYKLERQGFDLTKGGLFAGAARFEIYVGTTMFGGCSGIRSVDTKGGTSLPGLYAAGDVYSSKAVGARYPYWGFGLRNASVTGAIAGKNAADFSLKVTDISIDPQRLTKLKVEAYAPLERAGGFDSRWVTQQLRSILVPYYVWLVKQGDRLNAALTLVKFLRSHVAPLMYALPKDIHGLRNAHETKAKLLSAEMMLRASILRTESRASHYREDYPHRDDPKWLAEIKIMDKDGEMKLIKKALPKKWWPDLSVPYRERYPMEFLGEE